MPELDEIVIKILVELICTLALVTEKLKQRRSSESILADSDVLPYSAGCSKVYEEFFRGQGYRGGPAEVRPAHARGGSDYRS